MAKEAERSRRNSPNSPQHCMHGIIGCGRSFPTYSTFIQQKIDHGSQTKNKRTFKGGKKDLLIHNLQREAEYWRAMALNKHDDRVVVRQPEEVEPIKEEADSTSGGPQSSETENTYKKFGYDDTSGQDEIISFSDLFPRLLVTQSAKQEIKPFSVAAPLHEDMFLAVFMCSMFPETYKETFSNTMEFGSYPSKSQEVELLNKILELNPRILQTANKKQKIKLHQFLNSIINKSGAQNHATDHLCQILDTSEDVHSVEDSYPNLNYPKVITDFIQTLENRLPSFSSIRRYMKHFYEKLYPLYPYIEVSLFEDCISTILHPDPENDSKVIIGLGRHQIKEKIQNLIMLVMFLKISEVSLELTFLRDCRSTYSDYDALLLQMLEQEPITSELVYFSFTCLGRMNMLQLANEITVCYYLYVWFLLVIMPEQTDFIIDQTTATVLMVASSLANDIGIYKDPSEYGQYTNMDIDPRILNFRRKLWLGLVTCCRIEVSYKGRPVQFSQSKAPFVTTNREGLEKYITLYKRSMLADDPLELYLQKGALSRCRDLLELQFLDETFSNINGSLRLSEIMQFLEKINHLLHTDYSIAGLYCNAADSERKPFVAAQVDLDIDVERINNMHQLQIHLLLRKSSSMVRQLLFLHFEKRIEDSETALLGRYERCFSLALVELIESLKVLADYFEGKFDKAITVYSKISLDKVVQTEIFRSFFMLLSFILRFGHAEDSLLKKMKKENSFYNIAVTDRWNGRFAARVEVISRIKGKLEEVLVWICKLASDHLRYQHLFTFRMSILFDYTVHLIEKRELLHISTRILSPDFQRSEDLKEDFFHQLFLAVAIDFSKPIDVLSELDRMNSLIVFDLKGLTALDKELDEFCTSSLGTKGPNLHEKNDDYRDKNDNKCTTSSHSGNSFLAESQTVPLNEPLGRDVFDANDFEIEPLNIEDLGVFDYEFLFGSML